jgi:5-methylcytosine-specific restriction protein A
VPRVATLKPRVATLNQAPAQQYVGTPRDRGRPWRRRRAAWLREHPLCVKCEERGIVTAATEVDHVTPLWKGGADDESNLQSLCTPDHDDKTAAEAAERIGPA